jgi:hypothetical protein
VPAEPFDPKLALEVLSRHGVAFVVVGAIAAIAQGYPLNSGDLDITPQRSSANVERLVGALTELDAKLRTPREPVEFAVDVPMLEAADAWALTTSAGDLDLVFVPAGTRGYDDLRRDAVRVTIGVPVLVASLRDVIRMKEGSNRPKDQAQLPALRATLERVRERDRP